MRIYVQNYRKIKVYNNVCPTIQKASVSLILRTNHREPQQKLESEGKTPEVTSRSELIRRVFNNDVIREKH